jgi:hypothetical protein
MNESSHDTIERAKVREAAAIFHSQQKLEAAVEDLLLRGFDRSDMDRLADLNEVRRRLGSAYVAPEELADIGQSPRQPIIMREDVAATLALATGLTAAIAGIFTSLMVVAVFDGGTMVAVIAALLAACVAGGITALITRRILKPPLSRALEPLMASQGIVLWVRVRSADREETATRILQQHGGQAIRVHEIELEKRAEEIPLSSLRPDPWLDSEPLGRP